MFKIHGICLVKNEADIIFQTLESAVKWCDFIYVIDNGSTDGTWEKVIELSRKHHSIILYKQDFGSYRVGLRGEVFYHYQANSSEEDWWCYLDADEIYIDNPKTFLAKIPKDYQVVRCAHFTYYFTEKDLELYNQDPSLYADEVPVEQKCRWYLNDWSEPRFFRAEKNLIWIYEKPSCGASYPIRIRIKHYRYRSPQQIQKRLDTRRGGIKFENDQLLNWQEKIADSSTLYYDSQDGNYVVREDLMPPFNSNKLTLVERNIRQLKMFLKKIYIKYVLNGEKDKLIRT